MRYLVCGLPGTGKTTYAADNLGADGLCFDLDAIAAAFRLKKPHEERHAGARELANKLLYTFCSYASDCAGDVFFIRTAPPIDELKLIKPEKVIVCRKQLADRGIEDLEKKRIINRLLAIEEYCRKNGIPMATTEGGFYSETEKGKAPEEYHSFYGTQAWKACREAYKKQARGLCELCLQEGRFTPGEIVHHKKPLTSDTVNDPNISLSFDNLMLVCREHHAQLHESQYQKSKRGRYRIDDYGHVISLE